MMPMSDPDELPEKEEQAANDGGETVIPPECPQRPHDR